MANKLLKLAQTKLDPQCGYVWGSQGEMLTAEKLQWFKNTFGASHYKFSDSHGVVDAAKWIGCQVFDCSGLVLWCLQELGFIKKTLDYNADMFYRQLCTKVTRAELKPGDLVFVEDPNDSDITIEHIGIYAGNNRVVHAQGTRYGVVKTALYDNFNYFGRLKFDLDEDEPVETAKPIGTGTVINVTSVLNVRKGPASNTEDIGDLKNDDDVQIFEEHSGWYRIGINQWVCGDYIKFVPIEKPKPVEPPKPVEVPKNSFSDIKGHWAEKYIIAAKELGLMVGNGDGTFNPDGPFTRAQAAIVSVRLYEKITGKKLVED